MRRLLGATLAGVGLLAGLAMWRTPTVALIRLKLALDGQDLTAVQRVLDRHALLRSSLGDLDEGPEAARNGIVPTRAQLDVRLDRILERLVEDPEYRLRISWDDLRATLGTLRRTGAVAFFLYRGEDGAEYVVRMRQVSGSWRIVSVERDGLQALLARPRSTDVATAVPPPVPPPVEASPPAETSAGTMAPMVATDAAPAPPAHPAAPAPVRADHAFVRRLDPVTWTVQAASSQDAAEAEQQRSGLAQRGEDAFVLPVDVRGTRWFRVLVGRYERAAEAERTAAKLARR